MELGNCPFCGSDSVALNTREQYARYNDYNYTNYSIFIECKKCNCHGPMVVVSHLGGFSNLTVEYRRGHPVEDKADRALYAEYVNLMYKKAHDLWNKRT